MGLFSPRRFFCLFLFFAILLSLTACRNSTINSILEQDSQTGFVPSARPGAPLTDEEIAQLMPEGVDPDGDGVIATNTYWVLAQQFPVTNRKTLFRANSNGGNGKKILFFTRLNTQWLNFSSDLIQTLENEGYTVLIQNDDQPLQDISNIDALAIVDCLGTPFESYNDRPLSADEKSRILAFVNSGKGFYFSGDYSGSDLPKYNDIVGMFDVELKANYINYIPFYEDGYITERYLGYYWNAYVFEYINFFQNTPSQAIYKKEPLYGYSSFSNPNHEIFNNVNQVLLLGSGYLMPKNTETVAAVKTHPTTTNPRDYPITPEGFPLIVAKNYGSGRVVISCDSNCFANDGFAKSEQAGTDNKTFAKNLFRWLAGNSSQSEITEIRIKDMTTGEFVDSASIEMSSIKGTRSFKAIGFNNGTEVGPVAASWSLIGGDVASGSIREGILKELNVNVGKIGVFATAEGAKSTVENAEQVDFVSYLSSTPTGNIKIQAAYGSLTPVEVSIRLKQPKISIKINKLDTVPDSPLIEEWKRITVETWSQENLFVIYYVNSISDTVYNEILDNAELLLLTNEPNYLRIFQKENLDLKFIIVFDDLLNSIFGGQITFTRQLERFLTQKRGNSKTITVAITHQLVYFDKPSPISLPGTAIPVNPYELVRGWTSSSRLTYKRSTPLTPINDATEAGISLKIISNYNASDTFSLAHEIGHILIRRANDHVREDNSNWDTYNLMNKLPNKNDLEPIQWIHALGLDGDISYFVEEE